MLSFHLPPPEAAQFPARQGVWKAPASLDATLKIYAETGELNPLGINCLRLMPPTGLIIWRPRTHQGDDRLSSEWKYVPVRRTALFIEVSIYFGTQWVVYEPNDEPLWVQRTISIRAS